MATAKKATAKKATVKKSAAKKTSAKKTSAAKKTAAKKVPAKKVSSKRTLIAPRGDKRLIRRNAKGQIVESDDLSRSLSADIRRHAKTVAAPGQGDRGDQKPRKSAKKA